MRTIDAPNCCCPGSSSAVTCPDESECGELPSSKTATLTGVSGGADCPDISGAKTLAKSWNEVDGCVYSFYQSFGVYPDPQWDLIVTLKCNAAAGGWIMTITFGSTGGMFFNGVASCTWDSDPRAPEGVNGAPPDGAYVFDNPPTHHALADCGCGYPTASLS